QIAIVADCPARAVIEVVHDAEQLAVDSGAEQPHRLAGIVQPRPGGVVGLLRHRGLVEGEIALPQRLPAGTLVEAQRTDLYARSVVHGPATSSAKLEHRLDRNVVRPR